jgi:hypothetical protein
VDAVVVVFSGILVAFRAVDGDVRRVVREILIVTGRRVAIDAIEVTVHAGRETLRRHADRPLVIGDQLGIVVAIETALGVGLRVNRRGNDQK